MQMKAKRRPIRDFFWKHSVKFAFLIMVAFVAFLGVFGYSYAVITRRFEASRRWDLPSRIYSDATPILPGLKYPRKVLEPKLNHVGYHEVKDEVSNPGEYRYVDDDLEVYLQPFRYPDIEFPGLRVRVDTDNGTVEEIRRIEDGAPLRAVRIEPELVTSIFDEVMEDRVPVPMSSVPQHLIHAVIASEDRRFYEHEGISIRGILRAAVRNFRTGSRSAGGSTLTQQLVKNLFLNPERTYRRKALEAIMALILEARFSKNEILEAYLNEIYLGQNGSVQIVGVEQASQIYFSKHVKYLTLPEAATLAGILPSPNVYSPLRHVERATERRNLVLGLMLDQEMITEVEYKRAIAAPMTRNKFPRSFNSAPFFVDLVMKQLRETYPETQLKTEGLRIFTTLDTIMQRSAEQALNNGIEELKKRYSRLRNATAPVEGVVLTIQPGTGYVKALVGGRNYSKTQFNRAIQARRQPGSLFKPFVYVAAMDPARDRLALTASTILDDSPITVGSGSRIWEPQNYDGKFHGQVTVRRAIAHSYNIPAVRAAIDAGVPNVIRLASQIGVQSRLQPYPSISLGSFEVTPLEIAFAYSVFANHGVKAEPVSILAVATSDAQLLESRVVKMTRVAPPGLCYVMNDILKDVLNYGTAGSTRARGFTRAFAGKTGTTNNYRDAWFVGYSPRILSLVWVGFDDGRNLRLAGSEAAIPIWTSHMNRIVGMVADIDFKRPADVVEREVDDTTGLLATPYCPTSIGELYVAGTEPRTVCNVHAYGDEFPYVGGPTDIPERDESIADREDRTDEQRERETEEGKKKERGLRRLWRIIRGDGN